jgi:hypothetical protein
MKWSHKMPVMYEVNGYDPKTGDLVLSVDVPDRRLASVLENSPSALIG